MWQSEKGGRLKHSNWAVRAVLQNALRRNAVCVGGKECAATTNNKNKTEDKALPLFQRHFKWQHLGFLHMHAWTYVCVCVLVFCLCERKQQQKQQQKHKEFIVEVFFFKLDFYGFFSLLLPPSTRCVSVRFQVFYAAPTARVWEKSATFKLADSNLDCGCRAAFHVIARTHTCTHHKHSFYVYSCVAVFCHFDCSINLAFLSSTFYDLLSGFLFFLWKYVK